MQPDGCKLSVLLTFHINTSTICSRQSVVVVELPQAPEDDPQKR